jgi:hypothetical protein
VNNAHDRPSQSPEEDRAEQSPEEDLPEESYDSNPNNSGPIIKRTMAIKKACTGETLSEIEYFDGMKVKDVLRALPRKYNFCSLLLNDDGKKLDALQPVDVESGYSVYKMPSIRVRAPKFDFDIDYAREEIIEENDERRSFDIARIQKGIEAKARESRNPDDGISPPYLIDIVTVGTLKSKFNFHGPYPFPQRLGTTPNIPPEDVVMVFVSEW